MPNELTVRRTKIEAASSPGLEPKEMMKLASVALDEHKVLFGAAKLSDLSTVLVEVGNEVGLSGGKVCSVEQEYSVLSRRYIWHLVGYWTR